MNIQAMVQRAKKLQEELAKKQSVLAKKEFVVEKQGVKLTIMGNRKITKVQINPILVDPEDKETLEDLLVVAFNAAVELVNAEEAAFTPDELKTPGR